MFGDMSFCCISKWNWSDEYSISGRIQKWRRGKRRKDTWSRASREGVGAGGPNSEDGVGAGAREMKKCSKEYEHEEEEGLKTT